MKLHPASLGAWLVVRGVRDRRSGRPSQALRVVAVAAVVGLGLVALSLAIGGLAPWADYVAFLRESSAAADIVSPLNVGPASQLALLLGLSDDAARALQVAIAIAAIAGTAVAAWVLDDPVEGFAWATVASMVILPVTWFHYPVALVPVAIAAASRARGDRFAPDGGPPRRGDRHGGAGDPHAGLRMDRGRARPGGGACVAADPGIEP